MFKKIGVKVHRDSFIQVNKKRYSLPEEYRGQRLDVRISGNKLIVFKDYTEIRRYIIENKTIHVTETDFPSNKMKILSEAYPQELIARANSLCKEAGELIDNILRPHAYMNIRRAAGLLKELENIANNPLLASICVKAKRGRIVSPKLLKKLIDNELQKNYFNSSLPISAEGKAIVLGWNILYHIKKGDKKYE